jgi:capsular exopolysaccharide synthesis family protein
MFANHSLTPASHEGYPTVPIKPAEVHMLDRLHALYRYRNVAIVAFAVILTGAFLKAYLQTPLYRASVRLLIEIEDERTLALESLGTNRGYDYQDPEPYFQTQYRILTGRDLARRVVGKLDLARSIEFGGAPAGPEAVVDAVASRVVVEPVRASRLVDVSFVSADRNLSAQVVNALAEEYVAQNLDLRRQNMARSLEWLSQELVRQKSLVETSERAMAQYREDQNALSLEDRQNIVIARLNQLNEAATRARASRAQKESLFKRLESLGSNSPDTIPALLQNTYIQTMKAQVADLERRRALLSERYGDKHPEILTINASIDDANRQLRLELAKAVDAIRHDYESSLVEERTLASALEEQKGIATDLDRKSVAYTVLQREAESNRDLYQALLRREKELQVLANSQGNNVRLVERAGVPGAPFSPNIRRSVMLGGMVGLLVALGLAFGLDHFNDTIRTPDDVTRRLGLPFLGLIPAVKGQPDRPVLSASSDFGEAIRALRTSLALSHTTPGSAIVLVTSAQPLEGKTTTACNLAVALAYGGARVLLIDADMRRPGVHAGLGVSNKSGLADLLGGRVHLTDAVQRLAEPSLWVMPAGHTPSNPSELLASERMDALMRQVRTGPFDWVIIDTPPVLAVTDASIVARWASGVAFVLGSEMTRGRLAERAVHTLAAARPRFIGAVLNRVDVSRNQYYYAHHYGYGTGYLTAES